MTRPARPPRLPRPHRPGARPRARRRRAGQRLHGGRPVLAPVPEHDWESRVVLNPAAVLVDDAGERAALADAWGLSDDERQRLADAGGACVMLYRAQGTAYRRETPHGPHVASALGLAVLTPDLELVRRWDRPVVAPEAPFHDLGVEDPRCTRVGDTYYLYYTGYTSAERANPSFAGRVHLCLATTRDFVSWDLRGPVAGDVNAHDDKNGALFPEPVDGRWFLWHRPVYGRHPISMHLAEADSPDRRRPPRRPLRRGRQPGLRGLAPARAPRRRSPPAGRGPRRPPLAVRLLPLLLAALAVAPTAAQQVAIDRVEQMPALPADYLLRDWDRVTTAYDSLVFGPGGGGEFSPLTRTYEGTVN